MITKLFLSLLSSLYLKSSPSKGISFKIGTPEELSFVISWVNPPIMILSPFFTIAVVDISLFVVVGNPILRVSFTPSMVTFTSSKTFLSLEILGFTFKVNPISSLV